METAFQHSKKQLDECGFATIDGIYSKPEIDAIATVIENAATEKPTFRKSNDLFAIRQFLKEIPEVFPLVFNEKLKEIILAVGGKDTFAVKSIYFDKPAASNWFVAYHQDLTISVSEKKETEGFSHWTKKDGQFAVQPPTEILENIFTARIHLDDTDAYNGALKVLEKSHLKSVFRFENLGLTTEKEVSCNVNSGGVMLMKPLLFHGSGKTTNNRKRRVIHIEFSDKILPEGLEWSEFSSLDLNPFSHVHS